MPRAAARVLQHAIVDLKFRGAFIGTNVNGQYYNVTDFDPFWAKAQELDIMIVMHPEHIAGAERMTEYGLNVVCGNPADSTLSLGYMLYSGLFDRFPNLKICALHGGGFLPFHLGRFDKGFTTGQKTRPALAKNPPSAYLKKSLLRHAGLRRRHVGIFKSQSRRRQTHARHRLSLHPRRLDGGRKGPGIEMLRRRQRGDLGR